MPNNLAAYFAQETAERNKLDRSSSNDKYEASSVNKQLPDYDDMGPSVSMAVHADDDDHFQHSTFNLKRTRSMGLLDPYIDDTQKLLAGSSSVDSDSFYNSNADGLDNDLNISSSSSTNTNTNKNHNENISTSHNDDNDSNNTTTNDGVVSNYNTTVGGADGNDTDDNMQVDNYEDDYDADYDYDCEYKDLEDSNSPPDPGTDEFLIHHDDNDLMYEPSRHVDYLSHKWNENEISQSWRYIVLKKKRKDTDLINAARLENASWRTWAKARNNLTTVNPESLNWSKDSDVTWLYGPIVLGKQNNSTHSTQPASHAEMQNSHAATMGYGSDDETSKRLIQKSQSPGPKPILKKRTVSEIIEENSKWRLDIARQHRKQTEDVHDVLEPEAKHSTHDDYNAIAAKVNAQYYKNMHPQQDESSGIVSPVAADSSSSVLSQPTAPLSGSLLDTSSAKVESPVLSSILTSAVKQKQKKERHIHFNDRVEQCISLNTTSTGVNIDKDEASMSDVEYHSDDTDSNDRYSRQSSDLEDGSTNSGANVAEDYTDDEEDENEDSYDDDEEDDGLFISANIRKNRLDSRTSDGDDVTSSLRSLSLSKFSNPTIKPLPATTLNYGSDDEYYNEEENEWYYGNAVSHNVNTSRGFDYMYDYNSVYTGDTSNFVTVDNSCDIVDVPDGIGLDTTMQDANDEYMDDDATRNMFSYHDGQPVLNDDDDGSDNEFIEMSSRDKFNDDDEDHDHDSEDVELSAQESPSLRRTSSIGKSRTNSFHDFIEPSTSASPVLKQTHSFITGKPLFSDNPATKRPQVHSPSPGKFMFGSDSDSE
ncbi:unnamed protein product [Kluyveromyces dobzhanskii CBS 2104]|uniref:WGS project CCBQ000000000 data, contig 00015 n=1 Tax=Kluyveromyces dobzhanskii CBS 2104 TaxID=1427455 RepID=A0A0A8L8X7_9SACH|nr:unnamed protein product [Kluyveromyces dobzhanskii CBS 2104]